MKLNEDYITKISKLKKEPEWMLDFRIKSFRKFLELDNPNFGPELNIDFESLNYYKKVGELTDNWENVDKDVKDTFKKLGVIDKKINVDLYSDINY